MYARQSVFGSHYIHFARFGYLKMRAGQLDGVNMVSLSPCWSAYESTSVNLSRASSIVSPCAARKGQRELVTINAPSSWLKSILILKSYVAGFGTVASGCGVIR